MKTIVKFPFETLAAECVPRWRPNTETAARHAGDIAKVAQVLDVPPSRVSRWRERGITEKTAEEIGQRLGVHPGTIWLEWWDR